MESVITEKDGRVFTFTADLLHLDNSGKVDYSNCDVVFKNPLSVFDDSRALLGAVNIFMMHDTVVGEFSIDYSTPERLNIENGDIPLYPILMGFSLIYNRGGYSDKTGFFHKVDECAYLEVDGVTLSLYPPDKYTIGPING